MITWAVAEAIKVDWNVNIWEGYDKVWTEENPNPKIVFKTDLETGEYTIEAGSLNELIKYLTSASSSTPVFFFFLLTLADLLFTKAFIVTYKSFTTPELFLEKLIERYDASLEIGTIIGLDVWKTIKVRCLNTLYLWLSMSPLDWTMAMLSRLEKFLEEVAQVMPTVAKKLSNKLRSVLVVSRNILEMLNMGTGRRWWFDKLVLCEIASSNYKMQTTPTPTIAL